jgi:hypothetical protein
MLYDQWIRRERKIRARILGSSPEMKEYGRCRVCSDCGELCLCHELICPNCGSDRISQEVLADRDTELVRGTRMRLRRRFEQLRSNDILGRGTGA